MKLFRRMSATVRRPGADGVKSLLLEDATVDACLVFQMLKIFNRLMHPICSVVHPQTFVNDLRIPDQTYITLKLSDLVRFGYDILSSA